MTETANVATVRQERVLVSAAIPNDTRDKLLRIAAAEDLSFSDVVRRALKEYADKKENV